MYAHYQETTVGFVEILIEVIIFDEIHFDIGRVIHVFLKISSSLKP